MKTDGFQYRRENYPFVHRKQMKLEIMGLAEACSYQPTERTYAIRIASPNHPYDSPTFDLQNSPLYTIVTYLFKDERPPELDKTLTTELAKKILQDFKAYGLDKDTLLIHCVRGENRSPAVGMALNEIFQLGKDPKVLECRFPEANWYVYCKLLRAAKEGF